MGFLEKTLFQFQVGLSMYSDEDDDDDETPPTGLEETEVLIRSSMHVSGRRSERMEGQGMPDLML